LVPLIGLGFRGSTFRFALNNLVCASGFYEELCDYTSRFRTEANETLLAFDELARNSEFC
jgi:hypothetical protein